MSMGYRGKTTNREREVVATQAQAERETQWGEIAGVVKSFDPSKQTATVQPLYKPVHNGKAIDMPELVEVPVRFPRAGGFVITAPVKAGDKVSLRPQMRSSEKWHLDGVWEATDTRSFALSDYEAFLDGGESLTDPIPNFNNEDFEIRTADGSKALQFSPDGKFKMKGAEGDILKMISDALRLIGNDQLQINYGSSAGSGHAMQNKVAILDLADKIDASRLA